MDKKVRIEIRHGFKGRRADRRKHWWFVVIAKNGEPVATSETYTRRADARRGAIAMLEDLAEGLADLTTIVYAAEKKR